VGIYKSFTDTWNVEIGTVAAQFLFWQYWFRNFGIGSLQCIVADDLFWLPVVFANLKCMALHYCVLIFMTCVFVCQLDGKGHWDRLMDMTAAITIYIR
jgi:hypothetical protein